VSETKPTLPESAIPARWYNIQADMPSRPQPVLHPGTGEPVGPDDLAPLFPMDLILQEVSEEAEIPIPEPIRDVYRLWRPTPLYRAVKQSGRTRISTETGAGQWGSALALAAQLFGLECKVYMVKVSYDQKPYRRSMMEAWGATVVASPSEESGGVATS
jgi:tryptophan synthase beta chain